MHRLTNAQLWVYLLLGCLAFVPAVLLIERQALFEAMNLAVVAIALGVVASFGYPAWRVMRLPVRRVSGSDALLVGMVLGSFSAALIFGGMWLWRAQDKADWIVDHWALASFRWALILGCALILASGGAQDNRLTAFAYVRAGAWTAIGAIVAAIFITFG